MSEHEIHDKCENSWRTFRMHNSEIDLLECIERWRKFISNRCRFPTTLSKEEFCDIKARNIWKNIREKGIKEGRSLKQDIEIWRNNCPCSYIDGIGNWHIVMASFPDEIDSMDKLNICYGI